MTLFQYFIGKMIAFYKVCRFLQENNSPLLGEKFRPTICESFLDCELVGSHD